MRFLSAVNSCGQQCFKLDIPLSAAGQLTLYNRNSKSGAVSTVPVKKGFWVMFKSRGWKKKNEWISRGPIVMLGPLSSCV